MKNAFPIFYFTYGANHEDINGDSLGQCYTPIQAVDEFDARATMVEKRGTKWSMCYETLDGAGVTQFNLRERSLNSVTL